MSRYIDAEEVEKRIDIVIGSEPKAWDKKALKELKMYVVHAVPTADVRENVRGEWIVKKDIINCSVCKRCSWSKSYEDLVRSFNFCPNCGADMRGES